MQPMTSQTAPDADTKTGGAGTYVIFGLSGQVFGVDVAHVREILDLQRINRLPNAAQDCVGVIDTRGESIPIIDLCRRFAMPGSEADADTRIIVFEFQSAGRLQAIGTLADRVLGVVPVEPDEVEPAPASAFEGLSAGSVTGLVRRDGELVTLLALDSIFFDVKAQGSIEPR